MIFYDIVRDKKIKHTFNKKLGLNECQNVHSKLVNPLQLLFKHHSQLFPFRSALNHKNPALDVTAKNCSICFSQLVKI